jgi:NAD(P)-dependent dehydrogenase (short-subunit alcohol dehydrogenase family)
MQDKVITVTGGANGIGAETSRRLATEGALIVIADINSDQGQAEAAGSVQLFTWDCLTWELPADQAALGG